MTSTRYHQWNQAYADIDRGSENTHGNDSNASDHYNGDDDHLLKTINGNDVGNSSMVMMLISDDDDDNSGNTDYHGVGSLLVMAMLVMVMSIEIV